MMRQSLRSILVAVSLGVFLAGAGHAAQPLAEATPDKPNAANGASEDKVVCKRIKVTGSHMKRRVCQKRSVWRAQQKAAQEEHRQMLGKPNTSAPG